MISHPEKVLFPGDGITKGDLASYYSRVAPVMLPHIRRRPDDGALSPRHRRADAGLPLTIHDSPFTIYGFHVGKLLVARDPENLTREFHKVDRRGRILVDTGRNDRFDRFAICHFTLPYLRVA